MKRRLIKVDRTNERMINLVVGRGAESEKIPVYNQILRSTSWKFKLLVEEMDPKTKDLEIRGVPKKIVSLLIEYIYQTFEEGEAFLPVTEENVHEFFFAAREFDLPDVKSRCRDFLASIKISEENCIHFFAKTSESISLNFKAKCLNVLLSSLGQLLATRKFVTLTSTQLMIILHEGRATGKCSEDVLCEAAATWLRHRIRERSKIVKELIDEFPDKEHKRLIIQFLHKNPDPELQQFAFDLISELCEVETDNKTVAAKATASVSFTKDYSSSSSTAEKFLNNPGKSHGHGTTATSKSVVPIPTNNNCKPTVHKSSLKRPAKSSHSDHKVSTYAKPNDAKKRSKGNEKIPSLMSLFPPRVEAKNRVATSWNSFVRGNRRGDEKCCKFYTLAHRDGVCQLLSGNTHNFEMYPVPTIVPRGLARLRHSSMQYYRGRIYIMGGKSPESRSTNNVYIFNLEKNHWAVFTMLESRYDFPSVCLDGWMFVFGGRQSSELHHDECEFISSVEKLHLDSYLDSYQKESSREGREWVKVRGSRPIPPRNNCGLTVFKNMIYAIGGASIRGKDLEVKGTCEVFNPQLPVNEQWKLRNTGLSVARHGLVAVATEHAIFAIGGIGKEDQSLTTVEILRANSESWEPGPDLIKPRSYASGGYCRKRHSIFVIGGDSDRAPTVEKLDLRTKIWSLVDHKSLPSNQNYYSVAFQPCR